MTRPPPRAEILAIGDEIVHGQITDTNSGWLAAEIEAQGVEVVRFTVVSDAPRELESAIREACARSALVVATGGLGPTEDDRTRDAAAAVAGDELVFDDAAMEGIAAWFRRRQRRPTPSNRRQALRPASARTLSNEWGTAPGFALRIGSCDFFALPGVPSEMRAMFEARVRPAVVALGAGRTLAFARLQLVGPPESELGERLAPLMQADRNPRVGITAQAGVLSVRVMAASDTGDGARVLCDATVAELVPLCGDDLVCVAGDDLPVHCGKLLIERGVTLATAESCTGGLVSSLLTAVPGISAVYLGGYVTYHAAAKQRDLGVPAELIAAHGEVSAEVAAAMAEGVAARTGSELGISITGVAGPDGGTPDKPVGTVCFGLSRRGETRAWRRRLPPIGREFVRRRAAAEILAAVVREV